MVWAFWTHEPRSRRQGTLPALPKLTNTMDSPGWSRTRFSFRRNTRPVVQVWADGLFPPSTAIPTVLRGLPLSSSYLVQA